MTDPRSQDQDTLGLREDQTTGIYLVPPKAETTFSWLRTRMSVERTLMSWIRTATALIGFGFTIFQFFENLNHVPGVTAARIPSSPRLLALALVGIGSVGLIMAIVGYYRALAYLWSPEFVLVAGPVDRRKTTSPTIYAASLLVVVGLVAFGAVLLRTR